MITKEYRVWEGTEWSDWQLIPAGYEFRMCQMAGQRPDCYEIRDRVSARPPLLKPGVWRVGLFWSSGSPGYAVRLLAEGEAEIAEYEQHKDFIEWLYLSEK